MVATRAISPAGMSRPRAGFPMKLTLFTNSPGIASS